MRWRRTATMLAAPAVVAALSPAPASAATNLVPNSASATRTPAPSDGLTAASASSWPTPASPTTWSPHRLAAQLVLAGVDMSQLSTAVSWAQNGLGGIVLFGTPPSDLRSRLAAVRSAEQVPPLVASDEEGGEVQRLGSLIYPLHSAQWMGANRSPSQVHVIARNYGWHMHALGVDMDLAPVSDLLVPGHFIAEEHRAFASDPTRVGRYVNAWASGMRAVHVVATVKHWPGHGHSSDTHDGLGVTPRFSYMKTHDMLPFASAFAHHVPVVMVGHLVVPGLTETSTTPASLSPRALHYLRDHAGDHTLVVTDSLSMGAIRTSLGLTQKQAAVRALRDGADMALVQTSNPFGVVRAIAGAIRSGAYPRAHAVASVQRVLEAKRISTPPYPPTSRRPSKDATGVALQAQLSAVVNDRLGGQDHAVFSVRTPGSSTWGVVPHARVYGPAGTRLSYVVPAGRLQPAHAYEWRMRVCNAAGLCRGWTGIRRFTTV